MLGGRPAWLIARNVLAPANYRAMARIPLVSVSPLDDARRYLTGSGTYPHRAALRTPLGVVRPLLHGFHDMVTLNEVFFREDYRAGPRIRTVIDIGSNIGLAALYFLTRNRDVRCACFEPDPRNLPQLRENLSAYSTRVEIHEQAVAERAGELPFGREPSGRYGGLDVISPDTITVSVREINSILATAVSAWGTIDLLKLDTEGAEVRTVAAIAPELLDRVRVIYFEDFGRARLHDDRFVSSTSADTTRMINRALAGGRARAAAHVRGGRLAPPTAHRRLARISRDGLRPPEDRRPDSDRTGSPQ
jgi:FkbM family methyltransferase